MKTITKAQYLYLKSKKNTELLKNETVTIEDEEFEDLIQYSNKQITPIDDGNDEPQEIYTITFKDEDNIVKTITGPMNTYVSIPYVEKEGYEFLGWSLDGINVTMPIDGIYDSDITYIAVWEKIEQEEPEEENDHDYSQDYLTFEVLEDGTFSFAYNDLYYSTNNGATWKSLAAGASTELITKGTKLLWKRDSNLNIKEIGHIGIFSSTGKFNVSGNILSLFYQSDFNNFNILPTFNGTQTTCYKMFNCCSNLINAKNLILPSSLTTRCFWGLFYECTNLIEVPDLLNNKLASYCYSNMFYQCHSLNKIRMLASDISANGCLDNWVIGVLPGGVFIKNSKLTSDNIGTSGIPAGWEVIDEEVPEED